MPYSELGDALRTGQITATQAAWEMGTFIFTLGIKQQYDAAGHYWNGDLSEQEYRDQVAGNLWGVYLGGRALSVAPRAATSLASGSIPLFATIVTADGTLAVAQVGALTVSPALAGAIAGAGTGGLIVLMSAANGGNPHRGKWFEDLRAKHYGEQVIERGNHHGVDLKLLDNRWIEQKAWSPEVWARLLGSERNRKMLENLVLQIQRYIRENPQGHLLLEFAWKAPKDGSAVLKQLKSRCGDKFDWKDDLVR